MDAMKRLILVPVLAIGLLTMAPGVWAQNDRPLAYGQRYLAALTPDAPQSSDGRRINQWSFQGTAGTCVELQMEATTFDAQVQVARGSTGQVLAGSAPPVRIGQLPATDTYVVTVTSAGPGEQGGPYILILTRC
jgi:hypothetical protein